MRLRRWYALGLDQRCWLRRRYALGLGRRVAYLDADVGQKAVGPPTTVTLRHLESPEELQAMDRVDAMYFDPAEKNWKPGKPGPITAGRFDYGPELTVAPHPQAWAGIVVFPLAAWVVGGAVTRVVAAPRSRAAVRPIIGGPL